MANARISSNAGEIPIEDAFGRGYIYQIPLFQRPYKWKPKAIKGLFQDFEDLAEERSDVHFLGASILHALPSDPAKASILQVIDGQQRLTTVFLFIAATVKTLLDNDKAADAAALFRKYLQCNGRNDLSTATLHPAKQDQASMHLVLKDIYTHDLQTELSGQKVTNFAAPADPELAKKGVVYKNYKLACKLMAGLYAGSGEDTFAAFYSRMLQRTTLVTIVIDDIATGPVIYDRLNSGQEPMTIGDLVKNEVFNKVPNADIHLATKLNTERWEPFYKLFHANGTNLFDAYFFPFGLICNSNLKKSEVFDSLKERWKTFSAEQILEDLETYQLVFLDLVVGGNRAKVPDKVHNQVSLLRQAGIPASTYPFLMQVMNATRGQVPQLSEDQARQMLELVEDFLVRRAIIGIEPTGLHAVFKRLWSDLDGDFTKTNVRAVIASHVTVTIPTNEQVEIALQTRKIYTASITRYVLKQYDVSLRGDKHDTKPWIEHVYPQNPKKGDWAAFDGSEDLLHVIGNLVLLSEEMNKDVSNAEYPIKRAAIKDKSIFYSARKLMDDNQVWTPAQVNNRSRLIASWALTRWKY